MTKHFTYGGSTAARTLGCAAWMNLSEGAPVEDKSKPNPAADQGTMLHNAMEILYGPDGMAMDPEDLLDAKHHYKQEYLTQDLIDEKLIPAINAIEDLIDEFSIDTWLLEPLLTIDDETGGSTDWMGLSGDGKVLVEVDYKFGYVGVAAEENAQLQFYGMATGIDPTTSKMMLNVERIVYVIIQPNDEGDVVDRWESDLDGLDDFETRYFDAVDRTKDPDARPTPGPHCKYCPAHTTCPAKTGLALQALRVNEITADKLAEYLPMADELVKWAKEVQKVAYEQLELGVPIKGYKLVAKRAARVWHDEVSAEDRIRKAKKIKLADGFDMKLKSPAQLEKKCKELKVDFKPYAAYITSVSSGSTLAKESDKRPALLPVQGLEHLNAMND